jgi:hypothetical protein
MAMSVGMLLLSRSMGPVIRRDSAISASSLSG